MANTSGNYEITFILRADMQTASVEHYVSELENLAQSLGMGVVKHETWGLRSLAYPIKKMAKGHYLLFGVTAASAALHEFERQLRLNENVLRVMVVKVDQISLEPSAPIRQQEERGEAAAS